MEEVDFFLQDYLSPEPSCHGLDGIRLNDPGQLRSCRFAFHFGRGALVEDPPRAVIAWSDEQWK